MDRAKVLVEGDVAARRSQAEGRERRSLIGWVMKALRRIAKRKRKKDLEIYPLF